MKMVILILVGLVIFTTSLALLLYSQEQEMKKGEAAMHLVEVYVSAKDIARGELIEADAIKKAMLPQEFVTEPLTATEIVGRYAQVDILQNEPIRARKIALTKPQESNVTKVEQPQQVQEEQEVAVGYDTIAIPLSAFKNIDTSLKRGDKIDIVSVESKQKGRDFEFRTKYIAIGVTIDSFIAQAKEVESYIAGYTEGGEPIYAQSIVLRISPKEIKNFLKLYYKTLSLNESRVYNNSTNNGHLWIVKCAPKEDEATKKAKEKMLADYVVKTKKVYRKKVVHKEAEAVISYEQ